MLAACAAFEPEWVEATVEGRAFRHPPSWQVQLPREPRFGTPHFRQLFYVANVMIGPECVETRPNEFDCGDAIPPLENGDVVISWTAQLGLGGGLLGARANLIVDGHDAFLQTHDDPTEICVNADVAATLEILTSDHSNEYIAFCSKGTHRSEALDAFQRFVDSIDIGKVGIG